MSDSGQGTSEDFHLNFLVHELKHPLSLSIFDSEIYHNNLILAPMVGTLVIFSNDERPIPYIAESWRREEKKWIFNIRRGLFCENGEEINALSMKDSLGRSLKWLSKNQQQPIFKHLVGYEKFIKSWDTDELGINAPDKDTLILEFDKEVRHGVLDHLSMAPFGYVSADNFRGEKWKDQTQFISSGPYKITQFDKNGRYKLVRRENWPLVSPESPMSVTIQKSSEDALSKSQAMTLYESKEEEIPTNIPHLRIIKHTPGALAVVIVNKEIKDSPLWEESLRLRFANSFRKHFRAKEFVTESSQTSYFFYSNQRIPLPDSLEIPEGISKPSRPITIRFQFGRTKMLDHFGRIFEATFKELDWPYTFLEWSDKSPPDIYMGWAEIGGGFDGWIADMLFCSDLGLGYPDPSGRICKLAADFEEGNVELKEAIERFNISLFEDAALYPAFTMSGFLGISKDIDDSSVGPIVTRIRFDELRLKK